MRLKRRLPAICLGIILCISWKTAGCQKVSAVFWQITARMYQPKVFDIKMTASVLPGWHIYAASMKKTGALPTRFTFEPNAGYSLSSGLTENGTPVRHYDSTIMQDVIYYCEKVEFIQRVTVAKSGTIIRGYIDFVACSNEVCLPPDRKEFSFDPYYLPRN